MKRLLYSDRFSTAIILVVIAFIVSFSSVFLRVDYALYDLGQKLISHDAPSDIIIVAIDENSLSKLGRWPWPRNIHATLISRLKREGATVIGLDVIFAEPDSSNGSDMLLAKAIQQAGNVVLPVLIEKSHSNGHLVETLPITDFAQHAAAMGLVHVVLDEDSQARGINLWEGLGDAVWPHFSYAILQVAGKLPNNLSARQKIGQGLEVSTNKIVREGYYKINFLGPPGHIQQVSYVDVLAGNYPENLFKSKIVLIGAIASGTGDTLPTPVSGLNQPMSGVEFHANTIESIRQGRLVSIAPTWLTTLVCCLLAFQTVLWLPKVHPLRGLQISFLSFFLVGFAAILAPHFIHVWLPPSGALTAILIAYPIWSWRKLESAIHFLDNELDLLKRDLQLIGHTINQNIEPKISDPFQARISKIQHASQMLRKMQQDKSETLAFISHDIRAPLASMVLSLEDEKISRDKIKPPLVKALGLVEDFLHVSRAEMISEIAYQEFDIVDLIHQAIDDVYSIAHAKKVIITRDLLDECIWVKGEFGLLHRAIINLLVNAVKFSHGGGEVIVSLEKHLQQIYVHVTDYGTGIVEELKPHIFQRFITTGNQSVSGAGTGLGLYFVRLVAEKHGGSVSFESEANHQTTFTITLPIHVT